MNVVSMIEEYIKKKETGNVHARKPKLTNLLIVNYNITSQISTN